MLIQCVHQATRGGSSLVVDGYRLVDRLRGTYPDLWEFLTTVPPGVRPTDGNYRCWHGRDPHDTPRMCAS